MRPRLLLAIASLALLAAPVMAADPLLQRMNPQGGQRGTEVEVSLLGQRLGLDPQEILWYEPGIEVRKLERVDDNHTKATLAIPAEANPGRYAMRLRTATGISSVMTFHVGNLPEISEAEPNSNPLEPQAIQFGCVVNGVVDREDVDYFRFAAKQGERISVEVDGLRLGRTFFDPVIILYDNAGNELARCDDCPAVLQDACLSLVAPADGEYVVELRESAYRGDGNCVYRLHVGKFPRPVAVYPPGGRVGETVKLQFIGDALGPHTAEVTLPAEPNEKYSYYAADEQGIAPSEFPLRVTNLPVVGEAEPNNNRNEATLGEAPGAFYGVLGEPGDRDHFRFAAKKGQVLHFRLHARSIGSPMDSVLRILKADGSNVAGNDDDRGYPDSYIRFQAPEDGEYVAQVEDRLMRGGETFVYWLEAQPATQIVDLEFEEQERYIAKLLDIPRGNRNGAVLRAGRRDTGGDLLFDWQSLPPGVSVEIPKLPGSYDRVPVIFSAAADAPLGQSLASVTAQRGDNQQEVATNFTQRNWMIRGQNNVDMWGFTSDKAVLAVTQEAPYSIRIEQPNSPIVQRGDKGLKIVAERAEGFNAAILVRLLYNPPGVSSNNSLRIKEGENEVVIPVTANDRATVGEWSIAVRGEANSQGKLVTATPIATLTISEPYLAMELPRPNVEQGQSVEFPITIEQRKPFEGEAKVELIGLPAGVTTEPAMITSESTELKFILKAEPNARDGQHRGLFCRVTVMVNGEPVQHSVGYGELRVDKPLPPEQTQQASR